MIKRFSCFFRPNVRMWKKCDLSGFDSGMIVGLRIPETANILDFHAEQSLEFAESGVNSKKTSSVQHSCRQKRLEH